MSNFKRYPFGSWVALFFSSVFFIGFLPGLIHPKLKGKGGGLMGSLVALIGLRILWSQDWCDANWLGLITSILTMPKISATIVSEGERLMLAEWGPRRRHTGAVVTTDYNETCYDEVVGMFWAAMFIWMLRPEISAWWLMLVFSVFRVLDTLKPWPISWIEKLWAKSHPAWSVIADDVAAGIIAGIISGPVIITITHFKP